MAFGNEYFFQTIITWLKYLTKGQESLHNDDAKSEPSSTVKMRICILANQMVRDHFANCFSKLFAWRIFYEFLTNHWKVKNTWQTISSVWKLTSSECAYLTTVIRNTKNTQTTGWPKSASDLKMLSKNSLINLLR